MTTSGAAPVVDPREQRFRGTRRQRQTSGQRFQKVGPLAELAHHRRDALLPPRANRFGVLVLALDRHDNAFTTTTATSAATPVAIAALATVDIGAGSSSPGSNPSGSQKYFASTQSAGSAE